MGPSHVEKLFLKEVMCLRNRYSLSYIQIIKEVVGIYDTKFLIVWPESLQLACDFIPIYLTWWL